jgi:hypothetical protein
MIQVLLPARNQYSRIAIELEKNKENQNLVYKMNSTMFN